jgi:rRNA maturation protein Nop10
MKKIFLSLLLTVMFISLGCGERTTIVNHRQNYQPAPQKYNPSSRYQRNRHNQHNPSRYQQRNHNSSRHR